MLHATVALEPKNALEHELLMPSAWHFVPNAREVLLRILIAFDLAMKIVQVEESPSLFDEFRYHLFALFLSIDALLLLSHLRRV